MLTDDEIQRVMYEHTKFNPNVQDDQEIVGYMVNGVRAIEALLLSKLAAAEMPEPFTWINNMENGWMPAFTKEQAERASESFGGTPMPIFTADQLRAYGAACAARSLAKRDDQIATFFENVSPDTVQSPDDAAKIIRGFIGLRKAILKTKETP